MKLVGASTPALGVELLGLSIALRRPPLAVHPQKYGRSEEPTKYILSVAFPQGIA
jgi:hypothetical protein